MVLNLSATLWVFWLSSALISIGMYAQGGVGAALAMDLLPSDAVSQGMSLFSSMFWIAGIVGFGVTGGLIDWLESGPVALIGAAAPLFALILLPATRPKKAQRPIPPRASLKRLWQSSR